jgi:hypothetical protein
MRRQSDDYMAIPDRKRLARRGQTQRATQACRLVLRSLNAIEILQFAAPALGALCLLGLHQVCSGRASLSGLARNLKPRPGADSSPCGCAIKLALPGRRYSK